MIEYIIGVAAYAAIGWMLGSLGVIGSAYRLIWPYPILRFAVMGSE